MAALVAVVVTRVAWGTRRSSTVLLDVVYTGLSRPLGLQGSTPYAMTIGGMGTMPRRQIAEVLAPFAMLDNERGIIIRGDYPCGLFSICKVAGPRKARGLLEVARSYF